MSGFLGGETASVSDTFQKFECAETEHLEAAQKARRVESLPQKSLDVQSPSENERVISALGALPQKFVDDRGLWRDIGIALHSTGWPKARALFGPELSPASGAAAK